MWVRAPEHGRPVDGVDYDQVVTEQLEKTPQSTVHEQLKRAFFLSAFAALGDPASRAYYDKKIAQGKHHTQALLCLARRRAAVLFAMLRDGTFYEPQPVRAVAPQT